MAQPIMEAEMETSKISVNRTALFNEINENENSVKSSQSKKKSDFSDMVSNMIASVGTQNLFINKKDTTFKNNSDVKNHASIDDLDTEKELLKNDKTILKSIKKSGKQVLVNTKDVESKYSLTKEKNDFEINNFVSSQNVSTKDVKTVLDSGKDKVLELSTPISKENIEKIESILQNRLSSVTKGETVEIKVALKPEELGRIVVKAFYNTATSKIMVEMTGKAEAIESFTKNAAVISEGLKSSGIDFAGFSFKKENDKNESEKKESKNKKYNKENKKKTMLMEA